MAEGISRRATSAIHEQLAKSFLFDIPFGEIPSNLMCGIVGLLSLNGKPVNDAELIARMTSQLKHRGPDDEGYYHNESLALGFRRLSIIDLAGGHQPVQNEEGSVWGVLNGEIYNYLELRSSLVNLGHTFRTNGDAETIVHAYEQYGLDFVQHLRGMFAIALWDEQQRRLVLARDRVGKKPLFYSINKGQLAFASEMKALLPWPGLDKTLDVDAIHDYLSFLYVPAPKSIFKHVRKLAPAHLLLCDIETGSVTTKRYWQVHPTPDRSKPRSYFINGLREIMQESVRLRLRSDVPLGAFLSGGLDSTAVVGLASRELATPVKTFSMGFQDKRFDETHYARLAAKAFGTDHTEELVGPIDVGLLERLVWFLDEPFADSSAIPTYHVARIARRHVTVALSGDGGDELFAGYPRYQYARWLGSLAQLPKPLSSSVNVLLDAGRSLFGRWNSVDEPMRRLGKAFALSRQPEMQRTLALLSYYDEADKQSLYARDFREQLKGYSSLEFVGDRLAKFAGDSDPIVALMARDLETNMVDDALVKVDRMSMACSLEVRCPLLDHKLVEFAMTIPPEFKLKGRSTKIIFKEALADLLPSEIMHRGKAGFAVPFGTWFKSGEWRVLLDECLSFESVRRRGVFDPSEVEKLRQLILSNSKNAQQTMSIHQVWHRVWIVLMFEMWARQFLDCDYAVVA